MKKVLPVLLALLLSVSTLAYEWNLHGPAGIQVKNICFINDAYGVLCTDDGFYLYGDDMEWHFFTYYLPVIEAAYYSPEKILLIMGAGTYSDGIYTFDLQSHEFEVVEWMFKPNFIRYYEYNDCYYAASEEGGLLVSAEGQSWEVVDYFTEIPCRDIAFYDEHVVVTRDEWIYNLCIISSDGGESWEESGNGAYLYEVEFNGMGEVFALNPGLSGSSGVYMSEDYGYNWDVVQFEFFMTSLAGDPFGNVLIGWDNGNGIARVDPTIWDPPFVYLNNGLPDTHIHAIKINPVMSAPNVFVCTDSGVYYSHDYLTGFEEPKLEPELEVFPNPVQSGQILHLGFQSFGQGAWLEIRDANGRQAFNRQINNGAVEINTSNLNAGLYYVFLRSGSREFLRKIIIH